MKHDDAALQAAIDAAMIEVTEYASRIFTYHFVGWQSQQHARLALAKAFLARLEQAEPPDEAGEQVLLGLDDVPPGSIVRCDTDHWFQVLYASFTGICINNLGPPVEHKWRELAKNWQINTSIPDTGKWDASAWRPCSKPAKEGGRP